MKEIVRLRRPEKWQVLNSIGALIALFTSSTLANAICKCRQDLHWKCVPGGSFGTAAVVVQGLAGQVVEFADVEQLVSG